MIQVPAHQVVIVTDPRSPQDPFQVEGEGASAVIEEQIAEEEAAVVESE